MNHLKILHKIQIGISCGIVTGVWTNLYVNYKNLNKNTK